jgi:hypothetical protein
MQIAPDDWIDSSLEKQSSEKQPLRKTILASSPDDRPKGHEKS